jgi:hypothetical protein
MITAPLVHRPLPVLPIDGGIVAPAPHPQPRPEIRAIMQPLPILAPGRPLAPVVHPGGDAAWQRLLLEHGVAGADLLVDPTL